MTFNILLFDHKNCLKKSHKQLMKKNQRNDLAFNCKHAFKNLKLFSINYLIIKVFYLSLQSQF